VFVVAMLSAAAPYLTDLTGCQGKLGAILVFFKNSWISCCRQGSGWWTSLSPAEEDKQSSVEKLAEVFTL
jgi:hypothetical protein